MQLAGFSTKILPCLLTISSNKEFYTLLQSIKSLLYWVYKVNASIELFRIRGEEGLCLSSDL